MRKLEREFSGPVKILSSMIKEHGNPNQLIKQYKKLSKGSKVKELLKLTKSGSLKGQMAKLGELYSQREQIATAVMASGPSHKRTADLVSWAISFFKFASSGVFAFTVSLIGATIVSCGLMGLFIGLGERILSFFVDPMMRAAEFLSYDFADLVIKYLYKGAVSVGDFLSKALGFILLADEEDDEEGK